MTTKKHKVSAYLTDDEFEVLKGLSTQKQVSQSQIVILAIRELAKLGQVELMELPVSYLPNAISGVTKEDMELLVKNEVKTAITELETKFDDKLGDFKSFVVDTAPTIDGMNGAIKAAIKSNSENGVTRQEVELLKTDIQNLVTQDQLTEQLNELLETVTEGKPEKKTIPEIMPSQDSPITLENLIQDVSIKGDETSKTYEDSVQFIIESTRNKIPQKKIAALLNEGGYPTKEKGNWAQSMVSTVVNSTSVKFSQPNK